MYDDQSEILRRLDRLEHETRGGEKVFPGGGLTQWPGTKPLGPYYPSQVPNTTTQWPPPNTGTIPPYPPGTIWAQTNSTLDPGYGAVPPLTATQVNDLLKDEKYKGSSISGYKTGMSK
jgi:hypothetical protein